MNLSLSAIFVRERIARTPRIQGSSSYQNSTSLPQSTNVTVPPSFEEVERHIESLSLLNRHESYHTRFTAYRNPEHNYSSLLTLSTAPFEAEMTLGTNFLVPGDIFFEENPLLSASINESTQIKYTSALANFMNSDIASTPSAMTLDKRLTVYIQERYLHDSRPGQRQEMSNLICMILIMHPCLRSELGMSRRCLSGWKHLKPSTSASPLTRQMCFAFAWKLLLTRDIQAAAVLLLSFAACLRVSEALKLCWKDIAFPGDIRLSAFGKGIAGVNIADAKTSRKTGRLQFVALKCHEVIVFLQVLKTSFPHQTRISGKLSYPTYLKAIKTIAKTYSFKHSKITTHSARIGKALEDYVRGTPVQQIAIDGRWKSLNSLRYYLDNGKAWLLNMGVNSVSQTQLQADELAFVNAIGQSTLPSN
eukprot:TRINITY_DN466_c0_g1_i1.p1 TRINITY_DN466_c0_g1~~TRINITY_DN466_c0_g1_i1.p1  ORF type:complete len:419 (-),score=36.56 TRINITY_DN466_c0_g1_i1:32-1288(-)